MAVWQNRDMRVNVHDQVNCQSRSTFERGHLQTRRYVERGKLELAVAFQGGQPCLGYSVNMVCRANDSSAGIYKPACGN
jgi:hypothetical protein